MLRGQKVKLTLISSKTPSHERWNMQGLHLSETYYGELYGNVEVGTSVIMDEIVTSSIQSIKQMSPSVFRLQTLNSVYELTISVRDN